MAEKPYSTRETIAELLYKQVWVDMNMGEADAIAGELMPFVDLAPINLVDGDVEGRVRDRLLNDPMFRAVFELGRRYEQETPHV